MLTCFLQPLWLWNPSWSRSCIGQWYKLSVSSFSKWKRFGFGDAPSISDQFTLHFLLIVPFLEHFGNRNRWQTRELHVYVCICQGMPLLARPYYYCAKFMTVRCNQTCPGRAVRAPLFASLKKNTLTRGHIAMALFSWQPLSSLTFPKVFCLQTSLSELRMIGVFTS